MSQLKTQLQNTASTFGRHLSFRNACIGAVGAVASSNVLAIDTAAVEGSIAAAEADGLTVGQSVIAAVAALVVIGIVIAVVKKI